MKGVQCYELFGGIALKIHTFSFHFFFQIQNAVLICESRLLECMACEAGLSVVDVLQHTVCCLSVQHTRGAVQYTAVMRYAAEVRFTAAVLCLYAVR